MELQIHPLALAFPEMDDEEYQSLKADIQKHGQREPIRTLDGMILDGRHRYLVCRELAIEPQVLKFYGDDPVSFVISANNMRRHLTPSQRSEAVIACNNWRTSPGRSPAPVQRVSLKPSPSNLATLPDLPSPPKTNAELAALAGVSERTIVDAKAAHAAGLGGAVRDGAITAAEGARIARGAPAPEKRKAKPQPPVETPPPPDVTAELEELREMNSVLSEELDRITARLAVAAMEGTDEERAAAAELIDDQARRIAVLEAENDALKSGRDQWMHKDSEMQKQIGSLQRQVKRLEKERATAET